MSVEFLQKKHKGHSCANVFIFLPDNYRNFYRQADKY